MTDEMIDTSDVLPLDDSFFANAKLRLPQRQTIVRMRVDTDEKFEDEEQEPEDSSNIFDYLKSENGNAIAKQVLTLLGEIKNVTLDSSVQEKKHLLEYQRHIARVQWFVQLAVFTVSITLVGVLTYYNRFDPAVAVLLGTLVGYFFGKSKA
jgi:hypothetical protein